MMQPSESIARQVSGAAMWSYARVFADRVLRFGVFVVVARLVSPAEFGIVVLALLIVGALQAILDTGLSVALIQQQPLVKSQIDTAFVITLTVGAFTSVLLFGGAPLMTEWVQDATASAVLQTLAVVPLISGAGAVQSALIQRDVRFKALAGRTVGSSLVASTVAILLALAGFGVWALVARALLLAICGTVIAWLTTPYRPSLHFDPQAIRTVLPASLRLWAAGITSQINNRGFDFLAGAVLGVAALGTFRIAGQTVMFLIEITVGPMMAVGYAMLSRNRHDPKLFEQTLVVIAKLAGLLIFPAFAGLFVTADLLLPLMFGNQWEAAAALTPFMCAVAPGVYWYLLVSVALFGSGRADRMLQWAIIETGMTAVIGLLGAQFGLMGLAAAGVLKLYMMAPLGWFWLSRDVGVNPRLLVFAALPSAIAAGAMAGVVELAKLEFALLVAPSIWPWFLIAVGVATYVLFFSFSIGRFFLRTLRARAQEISETGSPVAERISNKLGGQVL